MLGRWAWFSDPSVVKRGSAVAALLAGSAAVLGASARAARFPAGYNGAQSAPASRLAARPDRWADWRGGATRDLAVFVPAYVGFGTAALAWAVPGGRVRTLALSSLAGAGAADVVETVLFRGTLDRLGDGAAVGDLAARTAVTRAFTAVKLAGVGLVGVALALVVAGRAGARRG